mgnify:CR=1 FL=1
MTLLLSMAGMAVLSKMIMLSRLLYFVTNLPTIIPRTVFQDLDTLLTELIWGKGRRRVALEKLQLPANEGGMGVPNFSQYYAAAQL